MIIFEIFAKILMIFYVEGVKAPLPPLLQSEPPWRGNHELNNCLPYNPEKSFIFRTVMQFIDQANITKKSRIEI